jgi:hypothetical protein
MVTDQEIPASGEESMPLPYGSRVERVRGRHALVAGDGVAVGVDVVKFDGEGQAVAVDIEAAQRSPAGPVAVRVGDIDDGVAQAQGRAAVGPGAYDDVTVAIEQGAAEAGPGRGFPSRGHGRLHRDPGAHRDTCERYELAGRSSCGRLRAWPIRPVSSR